MKAAGALTWLVILTAFTASGLTSNVAGQRVCTSTFFAALLQLTPCRLAVMTGSQVPPSEACCNAVRLLGQPCFCVIATGPPISGVDRKLALLLPSRCAVDYQPCNVPGYPGSLQDKLEQFGP